MEQKKEEQRLDEISDLLILMFHNGWWKGSMRRQAVRVKNLRSRLSRVNMELHGHCECQGEVSHTHFFSKLVEFDVFSSPEVQRMVMQFFVDRKEKCTGNDATECAGYRRIITESVGEIFSEFSSEIKDWEAKHGELERAHDRLMILMGEGDADDDFRRDKDLLTSESVFSKWMVFAQNRRLLHLQDRILKDEFPGKRKSDDSEQATKGSRFRFKDEGVMMRKRKLDKKDE